MNMPCRDVKVTGQLAGDETCCNQIARCSVHINSRISGIIAHIGRCVTDNSHRGFTRQTNWLTNDRFIDRKDRATSSRLVTRKATYTDVDFPSAGFSLLLPIRLFSFDSGETAPVIFDASVDLRIA